MITRSKLAEQLREYQTRSKHDWTSVSLFSSTFNLPSSRDQHVWELRLQFEVQCGVGMLWSITSYLTMLYCCLWKCRLRCSLFHRYWVDVAIFVVWELVILACFVFLAVSLYFRHLRLSVLFLCITLVLLLCMKITKQVRLARKKQRRMLLPLSM